MIVQKLHRNGQPPGVEARPNAGGTANDVERKVRSRRSFQPGEVVHEVVERAQLVAVGRAQQIVQLALALAREQCDAGIHRVLKVPR